MAIFLPSCLRLRISGTVTFCGFIGPPLSRKAKSPLDRRPEGSSRIARGGFHRRCDSRRPTRGIGGFWSNSLRANLQALLRLGPVGSKRLSHSVGLYQTSCNDSVENPLTHPPAPRKGKVVSLGCRLGSPMMYGARRDAHELVAALLE